MFGLRLFSCDLEFAELDPSILGLAIFESLSDLDDLVLVEPLVHVFLHLEVLEL